MSAEAIHAFGCGCTADQATGIPIETCRRHDQRTAMVKASAALQQMGSMLDDAGATAGSDRPEFREALRQAAKYAVKAAKALIGHED